MAVNDNDEDLRAAARERALAALELADAALAEPRPHAGAVEEWEARRPRVAAAPHAAPARFVTKLQFDQRMKNIIDRHDVAHRNLELAISRVIKIEREHTQSLFAVLEAKINILESRLTQAEKRKSRR